MEAACEAGDEKRLERGLHRICSAETTLRRIRPLMGRFGITRLADVTGLDRIGLPVMLAIRPNARSIAVSQGKGLTRAQAAASALMEAIEIWHAEHFDGPVFFASHADLARRHDFVDLARLPAQRGGGFDSHERLHWVQASDLLGTGPKLVPREMVHADYTHPLPPGAGHFPASTNGLASGNHRLEAICHGICEVIERDALALWHRQDLSARRATRLDPDSLEGAELPGLIARFARAGLETALWDVTSDIGIASFLCVIREPGGEGHLGLGSGSHPDRAIALRRACTEAAQTRLNYISGAREDLSLAEYGSAGRAEKAQSFAALFDAPPGRRRFVAVPSRRNRHLQEDLDHLLRLLQRAGIAEVALVDLARSEHDIPVVRVIIPGLEAPHDDAGYVPGARARHIDRGRA
ncbi:YcaO-like family protein [Sulfitobacter aestuarii]|uniref:YcaO-like family protein n=1 Tax=Sulfitobacter aestuarii TaxID=2161676 RepID=A0ABW5U5P9_9RHOB